MIIDSHAHYNNHAFQKTFRYLAWDQTGYILKDGDRNQLLDALAQAQIPYSIEPGIHMESSAQVLQLCATYPDRLFPAVGVHPTRAITENWADRQQLAHLAAEPPVIAIGECGLDYHFPRKEQHRAKQHLWFFYQLHLARKFQKPVILHVRNAHEDILRILRLHPAHKLGGVVHCFCAGWEIAEQYLALGYHIGIGGALLQQPDRAQELWDAVRRIPLDRILVETDAPYILPYCKDTLPSKQLRRARNSSLILPKVIEKIAQLKGICAQDVETATAENTIRLFHLPISSGSSAP